VDVSKNLLISKKYPFNDDQSEGRVTQQYMNLLSLDATVIFFKEKDSSNFLAVITPLHT